MKVGDLVRFKRDLKGLEDQIGIVVGVPDSFAAEIYWFNAQYKLRPGAQQPAIVEEVIGFLEVITERKNNGS